MPRQGPAAAASWLNVLLVLIVAGLALAFLVGFGARPAVLISYAALDDALFVRLGRSLAIGQWLGPYDQATLVKGIGFPLFLAFNNLIGAPFALALASFHLACAGFAAWVFSKVLASRLAGVALFALLLLMPTLYYGDLLRVNRELFYTSLVIALMASAIALASGRAMSRGPAALLTGVLLAWTWLTREEGVWLLPPLAILALLPLVAGDAPAPRRPLAAARRLAPFAGAALTAFVLVGLVGAMNQAVYGRFVINEIKDPVFQDALDALQEAGAPYAREMVPVPREARARIYAASPTFASIRSPILDGPLSEAFGGSGCLADKRICGDIGGGWFMWAVRESAAANGHHKSLRDSRAFYRKLTTEVRQACKDGRLTCESWNVPLVPPMEASQADDVGASALKAIGVMTFNEPVGIAAPPSNLDAPQAQAMYEFLNRPPHGDVTITRTLFGWFRHQGPRWFEVQPGPGVQLLSFTRKESADLAVWFKDPGVTQHRYELKIECPSPTACPVSIRLEDGQVFPVDLAALKVGPTPLGPAELYVDENRASAPDTYLKTGLSKRWVTFASGLNPAYRALLAVGSLAFLLLLARAAITRRLTPALVICVALLAAVAARVAILALIDALSFPAANFGYGLPAMPLLVMLAVTALAETAALVAARFRRRAA